MVLGIKLPAIFGKRNKKIKDLLLEFERLSEKELQSQEILSKHFGAFYEFLQEEKQEKIQSELRKDYADKDKADVLKTYLTKSRVILRKIRYLARHMTQFNQKMIENLQELQTLIEQENSRLLSRVPTAKNQTLQVFMAECSRQYQQRLAVHKLLLSLSLNINNMILIIEKEIGKITSDNYKISYSIIETLNLEKQRFKESMQYALKELGIEASSLEDVAKMEELDDYAFDKRFLDKAAHTRKILMWDIRLKKIAKIYVSLFYVGFQIVLPAYFAALEFKPERSTMTHSPAIYRQLEQSMQEVKFNSWDNVQLSGLLVKNKNNAQTQKAIIFVHGRNSNATWTLPYVHALREGTNNIDFLAVNMRLHGPESPNPLATLKTRVNTMGWKEAFDVVGAINYLSNRGYKEIVVYGHSMGGAAVINAIGLHKDKISANIEIKGVIVEKTWANTNDFFQRLHQKWMSNLGVEAYRGLLGTSYSDINIMAPSGLQWQLTKGSVQVVAGYNLKDNNPAEAAKNIKAPFLAIGNKGGDAMIIEDDIKLLANNAHGTSLIVESQYKTLTDKHEGEFNNPVVLNAMVDFIKSVI